MDTLGRTISLGSLFTTTKVNKTKVKGPILIHYPLNVYEMKSNLNYNKTSPELIGNQDNTLPLKNALLNVLENVRLVSA